MRVLICAGRDYGKLLMPLEKAFKDQSVAFAGIQYLSEIEDFLSRGNTFDRMIIVEKALIHDGNVNDINDIAREVSELVSLCEDRLYEQELIFVIGTEMLAEVLASELTLFDENRYKILLSTGRMNVGLLKQLSTNSLVGMDTAMYTKDLVYHKKETRTLESEEDLLGVGGIAEVKPEVEPVERIDASTNVGDDLFGIVSNNDVDLETTNVSDCSNVDPLFSSIDDIGTMTGNEFTDENTGNTDEFIASNFGDVNEFNGSDIDDIGIAQSEQTEKKLDDILHEDANIPKYDVPEQVEVENRPRLTLDKPEYIEPTNIDIGVATGHSGVSLHKNKNMSAMHVEPMVDSTDDIFGNTPSDFFDGAAGTDDIFSDAPDNTFTEQVDIAPQNTNTSNDLELFGLNSEPDSSNEDMELFGEDAQDNNSLERIDDEEQSDMLSDALLDSSMVTNEQPNIDLQKKTHVNNNLPPQIGNMPPNFIPDTGKKQKKSLFGLGKKKDNAFNKNDSVIKEVVPTVPVMTNVPNMSVQNNNVQHGKKKGFFGKGNAAHVTNMAPNMNNGCNMMPVQNNGPIQLTIDPNRVKDDELRTMMDSYRIRGNCMVITGTEDSGTSTMAANLANIISSMGYTVLLVDFDNIGRTQAYINKDVYYTIHSTDPNSQSLRLSINNKTGEVSRYATIVKEGLNLLTTGLAVDFENLEDIVREGRNLQNFIYGAKSTYNFVIFDVKFLDLIGYLNEIVLNADNIVLNVKPSNKALMEFMLKMGNIDDVRVREELFTRSGIIFNMATNSRNLLGYKVKDYGQVLNAIDKISEELTGCTGEVSFSRMKILNEITFNPEFDNYMFGKGFISDTPKGRDLYKNILRSILLHR